MRRFLLSTVAALATIGIAVPAFAADLPVRPRPAAPQPAPQVADWSGGQIGGSVGNNNFVEPGAIVCYVANCFETPFEFSKNPGSFVGGVFIGYRWQLGSTVFGVEGDATWQQLESQVGQNSVVGIAGGNRWDYFAGSMNQEWEGSVRLRYGWLATPVVLIYVTGGVSFGQVSGEFGYNGNTVTPTTVSGYGTWDDVLVGFTVGAGVEADVSNFLGIPGVKTRFEYRFTSYGDHSIDVPLACSGTCTGATAPSNNARIDLNDIYNHKFLFGLGFELPG